jgi:hypothetical protein
MLQLRQRVIATCHIGPLDLEETQGYIEHRLKCAGACGTPTISSAAFAEIFASSGGIPRRINFICDRLLLLGFLSGNTYFDVDEVSHVVSEITGESIVPSSDAAVPVSEWGEVSREGASRVQETSGLAATMSIQIDSLGLEQQDERLRRLERSMLRLERIDLEILSMLKRLLAATAETNVESMQ